MPPEPGLSSNTLRQVVKVSVGGNLLRLHLSNEYGNAPLQVSAVRLARSDGMDAIDTGTACALTFGGEASIRIDASPPKVRAQAVPVSIASIPSDRAKRTADTCRGAFPYSLERCKRSKFPPTDTFTTCLSVLEERPGSGGMLWGSTSCN